MKPLPNLMDQQFGLLKVISGPVKEIANGHARNYWECLCECGMKWYIQHDRLLGGRAKSCGCIRRAMAKHKLAKGRATRIAKAKREEVSR